MKKVIFTFGLIAGIIVVAGMFINMSLYASKMDFENGELLGYALRRKRSA